MTDVLSTYGLVFGVAIGVLSAGATFFNRQSLQGQIALLRAGNDELRSQNADLRTERQDLQTDLAACKARAEEREHLLEEYKSRPDYPALIRTINKNHKEVMTAIVGAIGGRNAK